jgi:Cu-Zn family superoxide dismutase
MTRFTNTAFAPLVALAAASSALAPAAFAHDDGDSMTHTVAMRNADGQDAGTIEFEQMRHGVLLRARLKNLTEGTHGLHLHQTGACSPDFKAAGGHYDPVGAEHGFASEGGYHVGDLPNVVAGADGMAEADILVPQVTLRDTGDAGYPYILDDADGTAVMIHAEADDYADMSSAGAREACGVVFPASG